MILDPHALLSRLRVIESLAFIPSVTSTNDLGRRVMEECISNDIPLPRALLVAGQQTAGRGRGSRSWHSPAGGLYASLLHVRPLQNLPTLPLEIAVMVAEFLRQTFSLDARIKWPNDILVNGRKIAGILIEARTHEGNAYTVIGIGINVARVTGDLSTTATSIEECRRGPMQDLDNVTVAFVEALDQAMAEANRDDAVGRWNALTAHRAGDPIAFRIGSDQVRGEWDGIDSFGRARIREGGKVREVSASDLILIGPDDMSS